jgi:hypothetical protein
MVRPVRKVGEQGGTRTRSLHGPLASRTPTMLPNALAATSCLTSQLNEVASTNSATRSTVNYTLSSVGALSR